MVDWRKFARRLGVALNLRDPPNVPPYGWSYFDHLVAVYVTLNSADKRADAVIEKARKEPDNLTWGDIFLMENIVFSLQPPEVVDRNAWIIRERFREMTCPAVFTKYVESNFPKETDTPAKFQLLKADLTRILDVLHWYYSLIPMRERMRKSLTVHCIAYVVLYTVVLGAALMLCHAYKADFLAMTAGVVYWGILGGFVSSQRRMQSIPSDGDPLISVFGLDSAGYYLWLSPLLGAIFAVVLALMFIAGILKGSVFPAFHIPMQRHAGLTFFTFTWATLPISSEEYGKLFVWAFLAGFAERLVPDSLDRLSSKLAPDGRKVAIPPVTGGGAGGKVPGSAGGEGKDGVTGAEAEAMPEASAGGDGAKENISPEVIENVLHSGEGPGNKEGPESGA